MSRLDEGTATHEAAHATLAVKLGFRVYQIYIFYDGSGQTSMGRANLRDASIVRSYIKVIMAGPIAELIYKGLPVTKDNLADLDGASSDIARAGSLAQQFDMTGVLEETTEMVKAQWSSITAVADTLLEQQSIDDEELTSILGHQ